MPVVAMDRDFPIFPISLSEQGLSRDEQEEKNQNVHRELN